MRSRTRRASTGATPDDDIATMTGERSTMEGTWNDDSSGSSTTLAKMRRALAASDTVALAPRSSVAATTSHTSFSQSGLNRPARWRTRPWAASSVNAGVSSGAPTTTSAMASNSASVLRSATAPPPTTSTRRPFRSAKIGKSFILCPPRAYPAKYQPMIGTGLHPHNF
ncbi:hypothetical protein D3C71_1510930 [compost metagenome]